MNRQELQDAYINEVIDGMDLKDMCALLYDLMDRDLDNYTDAELEGEVEHMYPHLLEEWCKPCGSSLYSRSAARPVGGVSTILPIAPQIVYCILKSNNSTSHA